MNVSFCLHIGKHAFESSVQSLLVVIVLIEVYLFIAIFLFLGFLFMPSFFISLFRFCIILVINFLY